MMGRYGDGFGLMWLWGLLLLVGIAVLVLLAVRISTGGVSRGPGPGQASPGHPGPYGAAPYGPPGSSSGSPGAPYGGKSQTRLILDERFARGELTAEQYRENMKVLGEGP